MHLTTRSVALAGMVAALAAVPQADAQTTNFNLAAGLSLANSNFGDRNDAGYALIAGIGFTQRASPISLRLEGIYTEYDSKLGRDKSHAGGITGNAIYDFKASPSSPVTLYAIGGIGLYSVKEESLFDNSDTGVGWNLGGGLRFPLTGFSAYVEARYHSVSSTPNATFTPIVFGLRF
jgi:opacity protein-like surface antigen